MFVFSPNRLRFSPLAPPPRSPLSAGEGADRWPEGTVQAPSDPFAAGDNISGGFRTLRMSLQMASLIASLMCR
eukprot:4339022-Pyramimonas_sp.AAC.1